MTNATMFVRAAWYMIVRPMRSCSRVGDAENRACSRARTGETLRKSRSGSTRRFVWRDGSCARTVGALARVARRGMESQP